MTLIAETFDAGTELSPEPWDWPRGVDARQHWGAWATEAARWLAEHGSDPRQAVVIVPVGALLPLVRQAWAEAVGGWLPAIDTIAGLVQQHAWRYTPARADSAPTGFPGLTMDPVVDRMAVHSALKSLPWVRAWDRSHPRALRFAIEQVVSLSHAWMRRLQACSPAERAQMSEAWLTQLPPPVRIPGDELGQPGQVERWLMGWGLEWAVHHAAQGFPSDALFELKPSAWLMVTAGQAVMPGSEGALTLALGQHVSRSTAVTAPLRWWAARACPDQCSAAPQCVSATNLEDEARHAAAHILRVVARQRSGVSTQATGSSRTPDPVALVALDRGVVRRVRALLEEQAVVVADETGWKLSTTRAAAVLSRTLMAAHPRASTDDVLDWLKSAWAHPPGGAEAVTTLEHWCRRHGVLSVWTVDAIPERSSSAPTIRSVLSWAVAALAPLTALWRQGRASLNDWSTALRDVLVATEAWADLQADPAGAMVISSLRLAPEETAAGTDGWLALLEATRVDGRTALTWMQEVLEAAVFRPTLPEGLSPEVVVTTLARAALRPFESVVVPGADSRQLGGLTSSPGWLSQSQRETMGLSTPRDQQQAQWDAFELVMCTPAVVCLHHQDHDGELVSASPWLQRWQLAHGQLWARAEPPWVTRWLEPQPVTPPAPAVHRRPDLVDVRMTATKYEALRQCPYQFFAKAILALDEAEELAEGVDGADYGNVLHLILQRYHEQRDLQVTQRDPAQEVAAWLQAAQDVIQEEGMAHDSHRAFFRPYQQQLERLAWAYVAWLIGHEREGWSVRHMEFLAQLTVPVGAQSHLRLEGRLDRMDVRHHSSHGEERHVIDYKSGQLDQLKKKLKTPLEDTQLLFYALLGGQPEGLQASYLHLGKDAGPKAEAGAMKASLLPHDDVGHHADQLLDGLVHDWQRILDGHGLPALGEGATCTHCRYRGLCRQDDWSTT